MIERHFFNLLFRIFCSKKIIAINDDKLYKIAIEFFESVESKKNFNELYDNLQRNFLNFYK